MRPSALLLVLLFTVLSYALMCYAFAKSTLLLGVDMPFKKLFYLSFISSAIANMVSVAGITGYTTKIALFKKHELRVSQITAFTLFFGNIANIALVILLPFGISSLTFTSGSVSLDLIIAILVFLALNISIFVSPIRRFAFRVGLRFFKEGARKDFVSARTEAINEAMDQILVVVKNRPKEVLTLTLITSLNWLFGILALGACFYSLGIVVPFGILITGFTIGTLVSVISIIPGGMGIQEATMAGVFSFLGINFGAAILAAILFRLIYQVLPFFYALAITKRWESDEA